MAVAVTARPGPPPLPSLPEAQARASPISSGLRHWRCAGLYSAGGVQAQR